jgi:transcription termination factor Rho
MSYASIYLQRYRPNHGNNNMGSNVEMQELQRKTKMHVSIRVNKPKKLIALFLDGNLVKQWTETDDWTAKGTGMVLFSQGQGQLRVSGISVTSWDGRLDGDAGAATKDIDLLRLNNGDKVSGAVKSIANGQVALVASFGEMNVPLERIVAIEFASAKSERSRRNAADIQAVFPDRRRMTFGLDKLDEQNLVGMSETCGRITAALGAFRRVQFNIYEKREDGADDDEWGGGGITGPVQLIDE